MRPLPDLDVFTYGTALDCGWTASALKHAVRAGRLTRLRRGVYSASGSGPRTQALAAALAIRPSVISDRSAVLLYGLPLLGRQPLVPELTIAPRGADGYADVHLRRAGLRTRDVVMVDGVAVTSVARTLIDLARHRPVAVAVAAIDAALHRGLVRLDELDDVLLHCWNWPGIGRAQRAVRLADGHAESPLESVSRLILGWLRLPAPLPQRTILDEHGQFLGRVDFYWDDLGVAGEADGRAKYDDRSVLFAEKEREELLGDTGLVVVRWGWDFATRRPQALRTRVETGFERGRRRDRSGLPRLWTLGPPPKRPWDRKT